MQILNNTSNTNFSGAFRIKRPYAKAKAEIPAMFTQGCQIFRDIKQKGDMVVVAGGAKWLASAEDSKIIGGIAKI